MLYNNKAHKYYNKFYNIYKKIITKIYVNYTKFGYFKYYYIKSFMLLYINKININYNITKLYSKQYSIMFLLYIIFVIYNYIYI